MMRLLYWATLLVTLAAGGLSVYALGQVQSLGVAMRSAYTRAAMAQVRDQLRAWTAIGIVSLGVAIAGCLVLVIGPAVAQVVRRTRELRRSNESGLR
jgi:hypothetical protein